MPTKNNITKTVKAVINNYYDGNQIELKYKNPYTLLVAVMLSAQATDAIVNRATQKLFEAVDSPEKMIELGTEGLLQYIKIINFCNNKAKNVIQLSKTLVEKFNSQIPDNIEDLTSLAGVGRKTANIILNIVFNKPTIGVDTHVFRVSNRLGIVKADNVLECEKQLMKNIPIEYIKCLNHSFVLLGRYICKSKNPKCTECKVKEYCKKFIN